MQNLANKIAIILPNREVRRVPLNWHHPTDAQGNDVPLFPTSNPTEEAIAEELDAEPGLTRQELEACSMPDFSAVPSQQMGIAVYETTTEGTPVSPVFPDTPQGRYALVEY